MVALAADLATPRRALDLGCGDGKNIVFLENRGTMVDGLDISDLAIRACAVRLKSLRSSYRGMIKRMDARGMSVTEGAYDLVIAYGLYHCLSDQDVDLVHDRVSRALAVGGMFAFAAFNHDLPVPDGHHTGRLFLRSPEHILTLIGGWKVVAFRFGEIVEDHLPLVPTHRHSLTWGLFQKV
jgi:cyclopropane fatty-acyl-phospholipid synthase-like methyltransferase